MRFTFLKRVEPLGCDSITAIRSALPLTSDGFESTIRAYDAKIHGKCLPLFKVIGPLCVSSNHQLGFSRLVRPLRLCEKGWPSRVWYLPRLPLFYPGLEIPCVDLLTSIHETIECDFWLDDIGVSLVNGKIEPPRCKNALIRLESECIYFTVEAVNGPLPNFESVSPAAMGEISRILGWGPWGSSPRDRKRMRRAWLPTPGNDKRRGETAR